MFKFLIKFDSDPSIWSRLYTQEEIEKNHESDLLESLGSVKFCPFSPWAPTINPSLPNTWGLVLLAGAASTIEQIDKAKIHIQNLSRNMFKWCKTECKEI